MSRVGIALSALIVVMLAALGVYFFWLKKTVGHVQRAENPRNVILISLDTTRSDRLTPYGAERDNSPNLARLAEESVVWTDCWAQSTSTGPSHRSLFTGQYVHRHGMHDNFYHSQAYSLASLLKAAGYTTAAFTGGGFLRESFGFDHGFDEFVGISPEGRSTRGMKSLDLVLPRVHDWLDRRPQDRPFFLFVHGYDPHCPYWPPEPYRGSYSNWYRGGLDLSAACGHDEFNELSAGGALGEDGRRLLNDLYDASIASADEQLGVLLERLRREGLLDDSLLIFTSDHGESLGEHGWVGHIRMWEEQIQVPLMIRFPGGEWAARRDDAVQHVDVLPTILDALGLELPPGAQGISLMPFVRGEAATLEERMRLCKFAGREAVRFGKQYKLIFRRQGGDIVDQELYDMILDPWETQNLLQKDGAARIGADILERYLAWREETDSADRAHRGTRKRVELDAEEQRALDELGYVLGAEEEG